MAGKVALITGGGRGIGRATAELFAREGARVLVATRTEAAGGDTVKAIRQQGGSAELLAVDFRTRADSRRAVQNTLDAFGRLDVIVHNAAAFPYAMVWDTDDQSLDDVATVNLKTAFWLIGEGLSALEASRPSSMLVVSSVTGNRNNQPGYSAYGASKAALNAFVRMAAREIGSKGVRVNGVEPGITQTDSLKLLDPAELDRIAHAIPLGRAAQPDDIAAALLFFASAEAQHITGQVIAVDGGQTLMSGG